jgi:hypothetical protein
MRVTRRRRGWRREKISPRPVARYYVVPPLRMPLVGDDLGVCHAGASFVWFEVAAVETLPCGLRMRLTTPASTRGGGVAGNDGGVPVECMPAA